MNRLRTERNGGDDRASGRDPRALTRPDWICLGLLVAALILAPLLAATFSTPPALSFHLPDGLLGSFQNIGVALVILLIVCAAGIAIWREWRRPVAIGAAPGLAGSGLLLAIWATLSLVRTPTLYTGLNTLMVLFGALAAGTLIARLCRDSRAAAVLVLGVVAAGTLIAALGIREYLGKLKEGVAFYTPSAGFINPDFAAGFLLLTLPVTLAAFVAVGNRKSDRGGIAGLAMGLLLALQSVCLMLTGSRTGFAAAVAGVLSWVALCIWVGVFRGRSRRIGLAIALMFCCALLASAPLRFRSRAAASPPETTPKSMQATASATPAPTTQSQSGQFRRYTWEGTIKMIEANPLIGAGLGSYEIVYPRYTIVASTLHAHNSLLQWTSETGLPGALLLMAVFAAATAFAFNVLRIRRAQAAEQARETPESLKAEASLSNVLFAEPALLIAGLLAALVASAVKTFMDSDWYIVPTTLLLSATLGLLVGLARNAAPLAAQMPRPLSKELLAGGVIVVLFLAWRAGTTYVSRLDAEQGVEEFEAHESRAGLDAYRSAVAADPYDMELRLELAQIYGMLGEADNERAALEAAARVAPAGKVYYRLAQFDVATGQMDKAIAAYERARDLEPKNLQTLRRLAEALDKAGKTDEADGVYRTMADLETSPFGTVRANADEKVETDFAYAHAGLARNAARKSQWSEAATQYARAVAVMRLYWQRRNWLLYQELALRNPATRQDLAALYHEALAGEIDTLRKQSGDAGTIGALETEMKRVDAEAQADQEKQDAQRAALSGGGSQ